MLGDTGRRQEVGRVSATRRTVVGSGAALGLAGLAGFLATACGVGQSGGSSGAASGAKSKQPVTLRVNYRTEKYLPERFKKYTEQNPNVTVEGIPDSGYDKLIAMLAAGDL